MFQTTRRFSQRLVARANIEALDRLKTDAAGNVLPMMAVGIVVLAGLVGGGVDMARAYKVERRLQAACDAGVLAGRRAVTSEGFDQAAETQARKYFAANFTDTEATGAAFSPSSQDDGDTINATATANLKTAIMGIFGFRNFDLSVNCVASMGIGNSDIVMVLDNTYSMTYNAGGVSRIAALRSSMKNFYDTVNTAAAESNARIRYGFVPYGTAVNVGAILIQENPDYVSNTASVQSRRPVNWTPVGAPYSSSSPDSGQSVESSTKISSPMYTSQNACNNGKPADQTGWTNDGGPMSSTMTPYFDSAREKYVTGTTSGQKKYRYTYTCQSERVCTSYSWWGCSGYTTEWYAYRQKNVFTTAITTTKQDNDPVIVTTPNTNFSHWLYKKHDFDVAGLKSYNATTNTFSSINVAIRQGSGKRTASTNQQITWTGCIAERQSTPQATFAFTSMTAGITPYAWDLDIDTAPVGTNEDSKWQPLVERLSYLRPDILPSLDNGANDPTYYYCPYKAQLLTTMAEDAFDDYADEMEAQAWGTEHDLGMLWGARIASPFGIFADNVTERPDNGGVVSRHLIFMTDGAMEPAHPDACSGARRNVQTTYGVERLDRRITGDGEGDEVCARHNSRLLAICEAIKARGIRLWTISFGTPLTSQMTACASPDSAFQSDDAEELDSNFQEIANQVGELRVTQ